LLSKNESDRIRANQYNAYAEPQCAIKVQPLGIHKKSN